MPSFSYRFSYLFSYRPTVPMPVLSMGLSSFLMAILLLGGCATGQGPYLFDAGPGARFSGVSEQEALTRARRFCADYSVGEKRLGNLLATDDAFRALTLSFYRGEMSNDEYIDRVLSLHPAADGNVPATGCVIANFNDCLAGNCGPKKTLAQDTPTAKTAAAGAAVEHVAMPAATKGEMSKAPELEAGLY